MSAPVRIADGAAVRLLRPGDRVDVIAVPAAPADAPAEDGGPGVRTVVAGARVAAVPGAAREGDGPPDDPHGPAGTGSGALLVLAVPRPAAPDLVAASSTSHLAVVLR
ncbi:RcpC/CpaB family pilus assembly protein [Streptomyces somaliensis]|uniref:RcpC/CpaB family pilus assembly protein n=1 Tax=Streptomyces somaliensis TaxID=78355 RepID=UPI0027E51042|nr:RcpC/CpaB family pilus assembly protein [Streptomyces somaliensis]